MAVALATLDSQAQADGSNANSMRGIGITRRVLHTEHPMDAAACQAGGLSGAAAGLHGRASASSERDLLYAGLRPVPTGTADSPVSLCCLSPASAEPCLLGSRGEGRPKPVFADDDALSGHRPAAHPCRMRMLRSSKAGHSVTAGLASSKTLGLWRKNMQPLHRERAAPSALASLPRPPSARPSPLSPSPGRGCFAGAWPGTFWNPAR